MGEVVYGVDFKAKSERILTVEEQSILAQAVVNSGEHQYDIDTSPCETDSGDCA